MSVLAQQSTAIASQTDKEVALEDRSLSLSKESIAESSKKAIRDFFAKTKFAPPTYSRDIELEAHVEKEIQTWTNQAAVRPHVVTAITLTITAYAHITAIETKLSIALFTVIILSLDDPEIMDSVASHEFHYKFCAGGLQNDPGLFGQLVKLLREMWEHYPRFSASAISSSALQFVNMTLLENETKNAVLSADARPFLEHRRTLSATAEAYTCFIWENAKFPDVTAFMQAIPDTMLYVGYVNDILSFYKEELAGETGNYIGDRASLSGKMPLEILQEVIDDTVAAVERIREILGEGPARDAWEGFAAGYISVHTMSPRYRLQEIIGGQYILA
ncbi:isoprenoid synthase domain-containing protein [Amylocystis lapponica]|nr:isoprenoid synthase domain-containing protein [Amylocystis lapponica]